MPFEKFTKAGRGYAPMASVWKSGQIGFNRGAYEKFKISDYKYAVLYYDREMKRIGIQFINDPGAAGARKIIKSATGVFVSAKSFIEYYDIPHEKTTQYSIYHDNDAGMYVIDLNEKQYI